MTDDGEFVNRCEFTDAVYEVRNSKNESELIVWYVHGWKHNAKASDSDLKYFKELIGELTKREAEPEAISRRRVVGIYVAWDAAIGPSMLVLRDLTFWNRKRAADRISQSAVLIKIMAAAKHAREQFAPESAAPTA